MLNEKLGENDELELMDELEKMIEEITVKSEEIIKKYPIITQFLPNYNFDKEIIEQAKQIEAEQNKVTEDTSDGFHTFKELYEFRMYY